MRFLDDQSAKYAYLDSGKLVLTDEAAAHFAVCDRLDLSGIQSMVELPDGLRVDKLFLRGCVGLTRLPSGLDVRFLSLVDCTGITELPSGLTCDTLKLQGTRVRSLPDDLRVSSRLDLTDCRELTHLPKGLRVGWPDLPRGTPTGGALDLPAGARRSNSCPMGSMSATLTCEGARTCGGGHGEACESAG